MTNDEAAVFGQFPYQSYILSWIHKLLSLAKRAQFALRMNKQILCVFLCELAQVKKLNDGFVLCLLSFQWIILHEPTALNNRNLLLRAVSPWRRIHWSMTVTCRSENMKLSKFTYKNVSKDQKLSDLHKLDFKWKSKVTSTY